MIEIRIVFWICLAIFAMLALEPDRGTETERADQAPEIKTIQWIINGRPALDRSQMTDRSADDLMKPAFPGGDLEPEEAIFTTAPKPKKSPLTSVRPVPLRLVDHRA